MDIIRGRAVYVLGNNIGTDMILAGRYLMLTGDEELAEHCFEGHIKDWREKVKRGDILVAGTNFGCESSREHAPIALKGSGIAAVVAESFGRIFFRNAIAVGLPVVQVPGVTKKIQEGDHLVIDLGDGKIKNERTGSIIAFDNFPDFIQAYLDEGGLANYVHNKLFAKA